MANQPEYLQAVWLLGTSVLTPILRLLSEEGLMGSRKPGQGLRGLVWQFQGVDACQAEGQYEQVWWARSGIAGSQGICGDQDERRLEDWMVLEVKFKEQ